jgi:hypothetical protein
MVELKWDINKVLSRVVNKRERYWLDGTYIRWGRIEKDINILIDAHSVGIGADEVSRSNLTA